MSCRQGGGGGGGKEASAIKGEGGHISRCRVARRAVEGEGQSGIGVAKLAADQQGARARQAGRQATAGPANPEARLCCSPTCTLASPAFVPFPAPPFLRCSCWFVRSTGAARRHRGQHQKRPLSFGGECCTNERAWVEPAPTVSSSIISFSSKRLYLRAGGGGGLLPRPYNITRRSRPDTSLPCPSAASANMCRPSGARARCAEPRCSATLCMRTHARTHAAAAAAAVAAVAAVAAAAKAAGAQANVVQTREKGAVRLTGGAVR